MRSEISSLAPSWASHVLTGDYFAGKLANTNTECPRNIIAVRTTLQSRLYPLSQHTGERIILSSLNKFKSFDLSKLFFGHPWTSGE